MTDPIDTTDRPRMMRILRIVMAGVVLEFLLVGLAVISPALHLLIRPLYFLVGVFVLFGVWQAARKKRTGQDRRQTERRAG
jgi:hypothetical protein